MDRKTVGQLLVSYADALESAAQVAPRPYINHLETARRLASRWLGGDSVSALRAAVQLELRSYEGENLPGTEAEDVGRALGDLCDGIGVET